MAHKCDFNIFANLSRLFDLEIKIVKFCYFDRKNIFFSAQKIHETIIFLCYLFHLIFLLSKLVALAVLSSLGKFNFWPAVLPPLLEDPTISIELAKPDIKYTIYVLDNYLHTYHIWHTSTKLECYNALNWKIMLVSMRKLWNDL